MEIAAAAWENRFAANGLLPDTNRQQTNDAKATQSTWRLQNQFLFVFSLGMKGFCREMSVVTEVPTCMWRLLTIGDKSIRPKGKLHIKF